MGRLQVLICTIGKEGLERIASLPHPAVEGVEYIVSWQRPEGSIPDALSQRKDFKIYKTDSTGLSRNRNEAFRRATAEYALLSDDDIIYTEQHLNAVLEAFERNPRYTLLTFKYGSESPREYPDREFELSDAPKGYFASSVEIGFNLEAFRRREEERRPDATERERTPKFDENFGIGAEFCSGEEDIMIASLLNRGHRGRYIPMECCLHPGPSTSEKIQYSKEFIEAKGAVMCRIKPYSWWLRMLTHAWRHKKAGGNPYRYGGDWLRGVKRYLKTRGF